MGRPKTVAEMFSNEREASPTTDTRARPLVLVQVSGGIADTEVYGDVRVVHIDWDNVEGESGQPPDEQDSINDVRDLLEDEEIPEGVRVDIRTSLKRALRWETDMERAPYAHD